MPNSAPFYPNRQLTYGSIFMFIKTKSYNLNPFDTISINEARYLILKEAREASPNYKMFIKAATMATKLSERTIKKILYQTKKENT